MSNFVQIGADGKFVINLDQVAYVDTEPENRFGEPIPDTITIYFVSMAANEFGVEHLNVEMKGESAKRFMTMLERQTGVW